MSGAQGKAAIITGASAVIAEVDESALNKRLSQGWITEKITDMNVLIDRLKILRKSKETVAIGKKTESKNATKIQALGDALTHAAETAEAA